MTKHLDATLLLLLLFLFQTPQWLPAVFGLWDCQDFPPEASSLGNVQGDSAGDDGVESRGPVECDGESSPQYPNGNAS